MAYHTRPGGAGTGIGEGASSGRGMKRSGRKPGPDSASARLAVSTGGEVAQAPRARTAVRDAAARVADRVGTARLADGGHGSEAGGGLPLSDTHLGRRVVQHQAGRSGFRDFFEAHRDAYARAADAYLDTVPLAVMWEWLEAEPPGRMDRCTVVLSPLVRGSHSTRTVTRGIAASSASESSTVS